MNVTRTPSYSAPSLIRAISMDVGSNSMPSGSVRTLHSDRTTSEMWSSSLLVLPGEIDVHGGARDRSLPRGQKERTFQYEPVNNRRIGEAIEKSLHREILE